ncbi:hypothetical protein ACLMAJ_13785 [Nocardia sp. KC 131]|uniref:hypothetical protein n=1 Tax=Nocardia arseniciresistens TaxID=3392119 RepID=UPI00398EBE21
MSGDLPSGERDPKGHIQGQANLDAQQHSKQNESYTRQVRSTTNLGVWKRDTEESRAGTKEKRRTVKVAMAGGFLIAGVIGASLIYAAPWSGHGSDNLNADAQSISTSTVQAGMSRISITPAPSAAVATPTQIPPTQVLAQRCPDGIVCWWDMFDFKDLLPSLPHGEVPPIAPGSCLELGVRSLGPKGAGSAANNSTVPQTFWETGDCHGRSVILQPGQQMAMLPNLPFSLSG